MQWPKEKKGKCLEIPNAYSEAVNRRTDNTMDKRKKKKNVLRYQMGNPKP